MRREFKKFEEFKEFEKRRADGGFKCKTKIPGAQNRLP